jgi:hypothetical protein
VVESSEIRLESLLLPSKNLRDASGPAARFSLGPPTGLRTATSDVEIAGYRVKADMALLFGRLAVRRVGDFLCAGRLAGLTMARNGPLSRCPPHPLRAAALDRCPRQSLPVREERHGQMTRGQQRFHRVARDRS